MSIPPRIRYTGQLGELANILIQEAFDFMYSHFNCGNRRKVRNQTKNGFKSDSEDFGHNFKFSIATSYTFSLYLLFILLSIFLFLCLENDRYKYPFQISPDLMRVLSHLT